MFFPPDGATSSWWGGPVLQPGLGEAKGTGKRLAGTPGEGCLEGGLEGGGLEGGALEGGALEALPWVFWGIDVPPTGDIDVVSRIYRRGFTPPIWGYALFLH